jgi:hypothetical protein
MTDKKGEPTGDSLDAELESISELLDGDFGEALGDLLGAPPPLPPPPAERKEAAPERVDVLASAPRPPLPQRPEPTAAPTDDEVFDTGPPSGELEVAFAHAREPERDEGGPFAENTRIASVDHALLRKARPGPDTMDKLRPPTPPPPRRGPAIVRRDRLSKEMPAVEGRGQYDQEDATRIADPNYGLAQLEVAEDDGEGQTPVAQIELDESFYDGIEIGAAKEDDAPPSRAAAPVARRITRNVVRRADAARPSDAPVVPAASPAPAASPPPDDGPETGEFYGRTGIYIQPEEEVAPEALAAAIDEVAHAAPADDEGSAPGSNPLIDMFGGIDFPPEEAPAEPLTGDLSIDLEGTIDTAPAVADEEPVESLEEQLYAESAEEPPAEIEMEVDGGVGEVTTVAPSPLLPAPVAVQADPTIDPAQFALPETGAPLPEADAAAQCAELEREIDGSHGRATDTARSARLHLAAGVAAERAGAVDRALEHYDEAVHADHALLPATRALRRLLCRLGRFQEALRPLDHEIELSGAAEGAALSAFRADLLLAVGEQDLARVAYGALIDARADDLRALMAQVELAYSDDREDELLDALAAAAHHVADAPLRAALLVLRGRVLERQGRDDDAAQAYRGALEAEPGERTAQLGLARLALRSGRPIDGAEREESFLARTGDAELDAAIGRRYARALLAADRDLELTVAAEGDALVLETLAAAHERAGRHAELAQTLRSWAQAEPAPARRSEVLRRLARLQAGQLGDAAAALETLRAALAADPDDLDVAAELEVAHVAAGDIDAAVALARADAAADPEAAPFAHLRAARRLLGAGRADDAVAELRTARAAAPASPIVVAELARALDAAGRPAELAAFLSESAESGAVDPAAALERAARAADAAGDPAVASEAWRAVIAVEPGLAAAHAALVRLAGTSGDNAALDAALAAERQSTRDPARLAGLAVRRAALGAGRTDALEEVLAADPAEPRAAARLARLHAAAGRWGDVAEIWAARAAALPAGPERDACRYRAAALAQDADGDHARAARDLAAIDRPGFAGAALRLERAHRALGDGAAIAAIYEREAADRDAPAPVRAARYVRLAETLAASVGDSARAATAYREAIALQPDDAVVRDGFTRVAVDAHEIAPLADLALADLRRAEEAGDVASKVVVYEELAHIDSDLRGDVASATLAWESAVGLDPARLSALRGLERTYLSEGRLGELESVYAKLGTALAQAPADAVPVLLERARVLDGLGQTPAALEAHREAAALVPTRMSLFRLETRARDGGSSEELAELDERIAAHFEVGAGPAAVPDARGQAAFLTLAGETLADLGRPADAIDRFRAAAQALPGFLPALRAWRQVALAAGIWTEVVEAAETEAAAGRSDAERARLLHLAGVASMDHGAAPESEARAAHALRQVLALEPGHDDAFRRLRRLYAARQQHQELAELLSARVEIEPHPGRLVELHQTLAVLYRDHLLDAERAKAHLRAVLARDPRNLPAVASLSDIAWTEGQWAEAAEALIARARLEKDPATLKEVFLRLGVIYADKLPDRRWATKSFERVLAFDANDARALEYLSTLAMAGGDWRTALGATERLVGLEPGPAASVLYLQRMARIFEEGYHDRKRAEEALRRATDIDPASTEAMAAVVDFYLRAGDKVSLRVNLDRIAANMRVRLEGDLWDPGPYRVLARALAARAQAGVAGSVEAGRCAAELVLALGGEVADTDRALAHEAVAQAPAIRGLGGLAIDDLLFHPSIPNGFRQIFRLLYDTLVKRYPADLRRAGVTRQERLPKTGHPVRDVLARIAADLGVADFDVYISATKPGALAVELTDPVSIVLGSGIAQLGPAELRFAAGRTLKLAMSYMAIPALLGPQELGVLLASVIRQYDPSFTPHGINAAAVAEEAKSLARLIPKRLRDEINGFAAEISGQDFDHGALWRGVQHTGNRAGLIASGSILAGVNVLLRAGQHAGVAAARGDVQIEEIIRFAVSNEHCEVRAALRP